MGHFSYPYTIYSSFLNTRAAPSAVKKPVKQQPSIVEDLVDAMLNGGVNRGLHLFANGCFILLFIFLLLLGVFWGLNVHVLFLLALCTGLMVSINWYVLFLVSGTEICYARHCG